MTFAEKIKSLRKEKGITQMQLAAETNISLGVIAGVESGRRPPSKEMALRFSEYFKVPIDVFIKQDAEITTTATKTISTAQILTIADIVAEYLNKNGYTITPEQRTALVDHFYQQNITDESKIKEMLSFMQAMGLNALSKK